MDPRQVGPGPGGKTFVGFGLGPIQSALFLYEASRSGVFSRLLVAEVDAKLVSALRRGGGRYTVNIARSRGIEVFTVEGVEARNPLEAEDRRRILEAIRDSDELCTALPSVEFYTGGEEASPARLIARGLSQRESPLPTVIYTAENHNRAAELLLSFLEPLLAPAARLNLQVLNTVIGKMSGVITSADTIRRLRLEPFTPDCGRAVLVEEFNRILIDRIRLPGYRRGIGVFVEKEDLLPFTEAKLYGHNAIHALIAYLAELKGYRTIAEAGGDRALMETARRAFIEESGAALVRRHRSLGDPLFTPLGFREHAEDLLARMVNPFLDDRVERVGRDPRRKLGLQDRLFGAMVLALEEGIRPRYLARGAAAGLLFWLRHEPERASLGLPLPETAAQLSREGLKALLFALWAGGRGAETWGRELVALTWAALEELKGQAG